MFQGYPNSLSLSKESDNAASFSLLLFYLLTSCYSPIPTPYVAYINVHLIIKLNFFFFSKFWVESILSLGSKLASDSNYYGLKLKQILNFDHFEFKLIFFYLNSFLNLCVLLDPNHYAHNLLNSNQAYLTRSRCSPFMGI